MEGHNSAHGGNRALTLLMLGLAGAGLAGCASIGDSLPGVSSITKVFKEDKPKLPGERIAVFSSEGGQSLNAVEAKTPVELPAPYQNAAWSQPGGNASNAPGHLSFAGGMRALWSADAGEGSSSDGALTALPIVADGRVFTLDTEGNVTAFSTGGQRLWRAALVPEGENDSEGFGGGLAYDSGRLFAATGFGTIVALDPKSGRAIWVKKLEQPFRTSPTAADGKVFAVNANSQLFCLSASDGAQLWTARGLPESAARVSNASPAVSGDAVVVPYTSGEVLAFDIKTGQPRWNESLSRSSFAINSGGLGATVRPVVQDGVVYATGSRDKMVATRLSSGDRIWSRDISATQTPSVAGNSVFVLTNDGTLAALSRTDGKTRWVTNLPQARVWSGPVLAGGKLWAVSDKGLLIGADARTGAISAKHDLDTKVLLSPVIAQGRAYFLTDKARLLAFN